ncbi:MAG: M20 family metallopeptidase [Clostridia bacterium]|nr:M20 family metallopeptidase [Clostridia bacterium]
MKKKIVETVEKKLDELFEISKSMYENPEISNEEFVSSEKLSVFLKKEGFEVTKPYCDFETGFRAEYKSAKPGPCIAYFCEYDALPGVGHGCGHNLICTMSVGAGLALKSVLDEIGGRLLIFGTPAEEQSGAKVPYAAKGVFDEVDAALMAHPSPLSQESGYSLALSPIRFEYTGKAAHAAAQPEKGINALDAVILLYNGLNALRQHVPEGTKIHGVITDGGLAPNIVPDFAAANFYFRATNKKILEDVQNKALSIAEGAAAMTGATLKWNHFEDPYDDMLTNRTLSDAFTANLKELGETTVLKPGMGIGSIDMGNVSYRCPAIHPWVGLGDEALVLHSKEFADRTVTDSGKKALALAAKALAFTGYDIITKPELLKAIKAEFEKNR